MVPRQRARNVFVVDPFPTTCVVGPRSFIDRRHIVYIAGWLAGADSPNGDGLRWFLNEINPHLQRIAPNLVIDVTGNNPPTNWSLWRRRTSASSARSWTSKSISVERERQSLRSVTAPA